MKTKANKKDILLYGIFLTLVVAFHIAHNQWSQRQDRSVVIVERTSPDATSEGESDVAARNTTPKTPKTPKPPYRSASRSNKTSSAPAAFGSHAENSEPENVNKSSERTQDKKRSEPIDLREPSIDDLVAAGLSRYASQNLVKYVSAGGRIYSEASLMRVYGMDSTWVKGHSFVYAERVQRPERQWVQKDLTAVIDINSADSVDFLKIPGIGPKYTSRILRFRRALGGFVSVDQVGDTYGFPDSTFAEVRHQMSCRSDVRRLSLMNSDAETLAAHPYISHKEAKLLVKYVEAHPEISATEDLQAIYGITTARLKRMEPYLAVDAVSIDAQ